MSVPFYVSPEQIIKDKADYARKGIARGRSVVVLQYQDGIVFVAENPSRALHKVSEIYDRIAFAAVGKYNEFENLRVAGIRLADLRGYSFDRRDVTVRNLANAYAQTLGTIFTETSTSRTRSRSSSPRSAMSPAATRCTASPSTGRSPTSTATSSWVGRRRRSARPSRSRYAEGPRSLGPAIDVAIDGARQRQRHRQRRTTAAHPGVSSRSPCSTAPAPRSRKFKRLSAERLAELLPDRADSHGPAHLRDRDRVRGHLHLPRPASAVARRGRPLPLPPSRLVGAQQQRVPPQRSPAVPRRRLTPGVRHPGVRLAARADRPRPRGGADPRGSAHRRRAPSARGGHRRRRLPVQEQHRLGRQLLRLPRELPDLATGGVRQGRPTS